MNILVTGGAGYIGSHCVVKLLQHGHNPIILDDFSNSSPEVIKRIELITGLKPKFYEGDILDSDLLKEIFNANDINSVIHFAGKKSVNESQTDPLTYFSVNVAGTLSLLRAMSLAGVKNILFSSTATVYNSQLKDCLSEDDPVGPINNYGRSKLCVENILKRLQEADSSWNIVILRYFNPVGAHPSGQIGENPVGIPANIMPYISQVAIGKRRILQVFGNDYNTRDGTGARDFIHVEDLVEGHLVALKLFESSPSLHIYNLGTGNNMTVLELIKAFEEVNQVKIPYEIVSRRPGDSGSCFANPEKIFHELGWKARRTITDICRDTWNWQQKNPNGYSS